MIANRLTVADYRARLKRANKYGAHAIICDGQRFDSKLERDHYEHLKNLFQIGAVAWFTRQVPFHLPGGIVYRADFLVVTPPGKRQLGRWKSGDLCYVAVHDCKGVMTRVSANKIKQVEALYGLTVEIITKGSRR